MLKRARPDRGREMSGVLSFLFGAHTIVRSCFQGPDLERGFLDEKRTVSTTWWSVGERRALTTAGTVCRAHCDIEAL